MAENESEEKSSTTQNLVCPLCLEVFEDTAILTCGHTFCRKCLQIYDELHKDRNHMVCPLCRKETEFRESRVEGLPSNVTVNQLVDEERAKNDKATEHGLKCTSCQLQGEAVSFCSDCDCYLCDTCTQAHHHVAFLRGHQVVSLRDIFSGKATIESPLSAVCCSKHAQEQKDIMFCGDCKIHVCPKCAIKAHRNHSLKDQDEFEKDMRKKVDDLIQRCEAKKVELRRNIKKTDNQRPEIDKAVQNMRTEIRDAYDRKSKQLKQNESALMEQIESVQTGFHEELDSLKSCDSQKLKSLESMVTLVDNDRLKYLEGDSFDGHTRACSELDDLLKEIADVESAGEIKEMAIQHKFVPASADLLAIGEVIDFKCRITKKVSLKGGVWGMAPKTTESVAIGYSNNYGVDIVDDNGHIWELPQYNLRKFADVAFQRNNTLVMSCMNFDSAIHTYGPDGSTLCKMNFPDTKYYPTVSTSPSDEILVANNSKTVYVFEPTVGRLKDVVPTEASDSWQAVASKSGLIITSSCTGYSGTAGILPSVVTAYDRNGGKGNSLTASQGEYLYVAVDDLDRVYVANVKQGNPGKLGLSIYELNGLNLRERHRLFKDKELNIISHWCYLVCLSQSKIVFASGDKLYFIRVPPL